MQKLQKSYISPWAVLALALVSLPWSRKVLRRSGEAAGRLGRALYRESLQIVAELIDDIAPKPVVEDFTIEPPAHECKSATCKCKIPAKRDFCNDFCKNVESSGQLLRCGCGHCNCDLTAHLGNESTFDRTTSA